MSVFLLAPTLLASVIWAAETGQIEFFERNVRPVFMTKCVTCHGDKVQMAGLRLNSAEAAFRGADNGPVIVKGDAAGSRLIAAIGYEGRVKMPPAGKLDAAEIEALTAWVAAGAVWPQSSPAAPKKSNHWAFQSVKDYSPPQVRNSDWVQSPVDAFILAKLEEKGLRPAPPADKLTLLRRAKFDLHGLPPTEQEMDEFLADTAPGAFSRLVDRLLASPRYGEKWGRNWLDVARYADSTGLDEDNRLPHAWRYRDYVIDAFDRDLPFDRFLKEQIMGDLMPADKPGEVNTRGIIATGFLALGPKPLAQPDKVRELYDVVDEQIDAVSKAFMGLTISCARCHDHKFDPIATKDYYSLASIFASTRQYEQIEGILSSVYLEPLVPKDEYKLYKKGQDEIRNVQKRIDAIIEPEVARYAARELRPRLADYMVAAREVYQDGKSEAEVARRSGLNRVILEKWVEYLKPGSEFRVVLNRWYAAPEKDVRQTADGYQKMYDEIARNQDHKLDEWMEKVQTAVKEGKPLPGKPNFDANEFVQFEPRFYEDISGKEGPFNVDEEARDRILSKESKAQVAALKKQMESMKKSAPGQPPMANAVVEGKVIEQAVFIRGSHSSPGEIVPKRFPVVLAGDTQPPVTQGSGRRELAEWLARPDHQLVPRVMANRIWLWHFGDGLVRTPDNFGLMGQRPTHPELLDYLATQFVKNGWSMKGMHRLLMLSSTYQMSSAPTPEAEQSDPANRLWSHQHRRRLTYEEMRDAFLAVDGALDLTMGGSVASKLTGDKYEKRDSADPDVIRRRSVYLPAVRNKLPTTMRLFDFVDATTVNGQRGESSVAPQALYLMNSGFIQERSRAFAKYVLAQPESTDRARVRRAYRIALARAPSADEVSTALNYIANYPRSAKAKVETRLKAWQSLCHALMVSSEFNYVD